MKKQNELKKISILPTTRDCNTPTYNMNDFILLCGTASY